ncbi:YSIRK-type signal peptide-containing protein, partial [Streptococcus ruminantium]|uniref:YSIRK-type signal peptide-containing protein n=2 Tax=Streptococcus ruminantium TaxID=1917441 RepID=UPI0012DC1AB3
MFSHKNKKYSLRKVKNGVASVVIALLFASVTAPVAQARSVVGDGGDSAQVSSLGTTVLLSSGGFGTVHDGSPLLGGSGGSRSGSLPGASGDTLPLAGESGSGGERNGLSGHNGGKTLPGLSGERSGLSGHNGGKTLPGL